jgi:hypothetical protein
MSTTYTATPDTLAGGDVLTVTNPVDGDALTAASNNAAIVTLANRVKGLNDLLASSRSRSKFYPAKVAETSGGGFVAGLAHRSMNSLTDTTTGAITARFAILDIPYRAVITQIQPIAVNNSAGLIGFTCYATKVDSLASYTALENGGAGQVLVASGSGGVPGIIPLTSTTASKTWSNASGSEFLIVEVTFTGASSSSISISGVQVNYTIIGP